MTVEWTAPGEQLIANEQFAYFSPLWLSVKKAGNVHPFKIKSVGLTQEPNIQFLAIACEEEQTTEGDSMNPLLEKLKLLLPEADREQITTEELLIAALEKMLADKKEVVPDPAVAEAANELPGVKATLTETSNQLVVANEALQGLRKSHSKLLLDCALQDGRITPATRAKWEERFQGSEEFTALANELGRIDPVMKTSRITKGAKPGDNGGATHADVIALANEMCGDGKTSFESAYARAKKDPKFAHLFQVKQADAQ
jgi:phage I-like protein